jgi:UDP-glucose 4-epimerase
MDLKEAYAGRTVLVTGAAGFIGSHLAERLVMLGARVRGLDDMSEGREENLAALHNTIEFRPASILEPDTVADAMKGCNFVFHLAANASVPRSSAMPDLDFEANALGTFRIIDAVRHVSTTRLVFASSAAVYGEPVGTATTEDDPLRPQSPYAGSKLAGEFLCEAYARCFDFDCRRIRIFNTYGPRQRRYVMFDLLEKLRRNPRRLEIIGTGQQVRDYSYVADTVEAFLVVGAHPEARGRIFNVAGGHPTSICELTAALVETTGIDPPLLEFTGQSWAGDVVRMVGDTTQLRSLGWAPKTALHEGLSRLVVWHREAFKPPW